MKNLVMGGELV